MDQANDAEYQEYLEKKKLQTIRNSVINLTHEITKTFAFTDIQCAELIAKKGDVKITSAGKKPCMFVWNKDTLLWEPKENIPKILTAIYRLLVPGFQEKLDQANTKLATLMAQGFATDDVNKCQKALETARKKVVGLGSANKLQNIFRSCGKCMVIETDFNKKLTTESLLPIKKNVINLKTLEQRPRTKQDMFNFTLNYDMTEDTKDAEEFLKDLCPKDDEDTYQNLLDCLSYMITPWNFLKKFFVFWGPDGNNGKSALMSVLECMLGDLYTSVSEDLFTEKTTSAGAATPALTQCVNKFVGVYGETKKALLNENTIKMITGDDTITYRKLFGEAQKIRLFMKLVLVGNYKPNWSHNSPMANRIAFFYFNNKFVDNPTQPRHRKKDWERVKRVKKGHQMFSLLVRNAASLYKRGKIHSSPFIEKAFKEYICEVDTTSQFIETSIIRQSKGGMTIGQIFDAYKQWCQDNNTYCEKKGAFTAKFKKKIPPRSKLLRGNTVYDVSLATDKRAQSVFVDPSTLDDYMREEHKGLLNEIDELTLERDTMEEERDETEKMMYGALDLVEEQAQKLRELELQIQQLYKQGGKEKKYQKGIYANLAKQAQGMMKMRFLRNRNPFA